MKAKVTIYQETYNWGTFKKLEPDTEYPAGPITVGTERKIWFLQTLDYQKMQFPKPGTYSIINKSTTFPHFCCPSVNLLNFASFLHKSQQLLVFKNNRILVETRKITCLLTVNKYLHQLPWVDCAIVEPSQKKKEFQYQVVVYIKP